MNMKSTITSLLVVAGLLTPNAFAKGVSHARTSHSKVSRPSVGHSTKSKATKSGPTRKVKTRKGSPLAKSGNKAKARKMGARKSKAGSKVGTRTHKRISPQAVGKVQVPKDLAKGKKAQPENQTPQS